MSICRVHYASKLMHYVNTRAIRLFRGCQYSHEKRCDCVVVLWNDDKLTTVGPLFPRISYVTRVQLYLFGRPASAFWNAKQSCLSLGRGGGVIAKRNMSVTVPSSDLFVWVTPQGFLTLPSGWEVRLPVLEPDISPWTFILLDSPHRKCTSGTFPIRILHGRISFMGVLLLSETTSG